MKTTDQISYEVVTGRVSNLRRHDTKVNPLRGSVDNGVASLSAVAQAALNLPGATSSADLANDEGDAVEAFSMDVAGRSIAGYLWSVGFSEGDEVSVAGNTRGSLFDAVAIKRARDRSIWLRPHYTMGSQAIRRGDRVRIIKCCLAVNLIGLTAIPLMALMTSDGDEPWTRIFATLAAGCVLFDVACTFLLRTPRLLDFGKQVDAIGRALEIPEPETINFDQTYDQARAAGQPYISGGKYY